MHLATNAVPQHPAGVTTALALCALFYAVNLQLVGSRRPQSLYFGTFDFRKKALRVSFAMVSACISWFGAAKNTFSSKFIHENCFTKGFKCILLFATVKQELEKL